MKPEQLEKFKNFFKSPRFVQGASGYPIFLNSAARSGFLMQKAVAFVTDEGGITSHAAIVSRELGIPCIIGTKIATKVLKDGDMVEVDAENGVVKIIKRST